MNVDPRMLKSRTALVIEQPFFGTLAMHLVVRQSTACTTMATDGKSLWYNPAFLDRPENTPEVIRFIWAHEVMHCALGHHTRRVARDPIIWNVACDHVVNLILQKAGFTIPPNRYCDAAYEGLTAEQVYRILTQPQQQDDQDEDDQQDPQDAGDDKAQDAPGDEGEPDSGDNPDTDKAGDDGQASASDKADQSGNGDDGSPTDEDGGGSGGDGCGDGQGQGTSSEAGQGSGSISADDGDPEPAFHGDPGECGEVIDAAPSHQKAALDEAADEWEVFTRQAVNIAKRQGEGKMPGYLEEVVTHLDVPKTDWRDVLRRFVDPQSSTKDYSWRMPSRRLMAMGYFVPGLVSDGIQHVAIIIDSSYSIDSALLATFGSEVQAALDEGGIDRVTLLFCDTRVTKAASYEKGDIIDFEVPGRGGTAFSPAFQWVNQNTDDVACAIYFTDLECSDYGPEPIYPVLWAGYGDPRTLREHAAAVPWGEIVEVA